METIKNCFTKCSIVGEMAECSDKHEEDFVELFNELKKEMNNMEDQMTPDEYANVDNKESTSPPELNSNVVDWKGATIEVCINEYVTERDAEVLASDDDNEKNGVAEVSEKIEPVVSYSEALVLLDKPAYVNGMSSKNIDILF